MNAKDYFLINEFAKIKFPLFAKLTLIYFNFIFLNIFKAWFKPFSDREYIFIKYFRKLMIVSSVVWVLSLFLFIAISNTMLLITLIHQKLNLGVLGIFLGYAILQYITTTIQTTAFYLLTTYGMSIDKINKSVGVGDWPISMTFDIVERTTQPPTDLNQQLKINISKIKNIYDPFVELNAFPNLGDNIISTNDYVKRYGNINNDYTHSNNSSQTSNTHIIIIVVTTLIAVSIAIATAIIILKKKKNKAINICINF